MWTHNPSKRAAADPCLRPRTKKERKKERKKEKRKKKEKKERRYLIWYNRNSNFSNVYNTANIYVIHNILHSFGISKNEIRVYRLRQNWGRNESEKCWSQIIRIKLWWCFVLLHHAVTKCYLLTQLATRTHRFGTATLNYTVGLNFQTGITRRKIKQTKQHRV